MEETSMEETSINKIVYRNNTPILYQLQPHETTEFGNDPSDFYTVGSINNIMDDNLDNTQLTSIREDSLNSYLSDTAGSLSLSQNKINMSSLFDSAKGESIESLESELDKNIRIRGLFFIF